jgi:hypothetical protein
MGISIGIGSTGRQWRQIADSASRVGEASSLVRGDAGMCRSDFAARTKRCPLLDATASGVYVIAVTPFLNDGRLDEPSTDRMVDFYAGCGATGLTILGIMGEAPKLEPEESLGIVKRAVAGMPGKPVIVGVSAPGFAAMRPSSTRPRPSPSPAAW